MEYQTTKRTMSCDRGQLHIHVGPMYAKKTSKLIEKYREYIHSGEHVIVLTHSSEVRYSIDQLSTHDQQKISCFKFNSIGEFIENIGEQLTMAHVILVDESQFFPDLYKLISLVDNLHKTVHVFGLDGDFKRNKFGQIFDLIPYCDSIEKLTSVCAHCNQPAIFSSRIVKSTEQVLVGANESYEPLCRNCYNLTSI